MTVKQEKMLRLAVFRKSSSYFEPSSFEGFMEVPSSSLSEVEVVDLASEGPLKPVKVRVVTYFGQTYRLKTFVFYKRVNGEWAESALEAPTERFEGFVLSRMCVRNPVDVHLDENYEHASW